MRLLNPIVAVLVAVLVVLFAVSNRTRVAVEIWPFPFRIELGLYALILLSVFVGFVAGLLAAWRAGWKKRRELKALRREAKDLQASLARANAIAGAAETPPR